jgi:Kazal-type serine protease inhibitor domain
MGCSPPGAEGTGQPIRTTTTVRPAEAEESTGSLVALTLRPENEGSTSGRPAIITTESGSAPSPGEALTAENTRVSTQTTTAQRSSHTEHTPTINPTEQTEGVHDQTTRSINEADVTTIVQSTTMRQLNTGAETSTEVTTLEQSSELPRGSTTPEGVPDSTIPTLTEEPATTTSQSTTSYIHFTTASLFNTAATGALSERTITLMPHSTTSASIGTTTAVDPRTSEMSAPSGVTVVTQPSPNSHATETITPSTASESIFGSTRQAFTEKEVTTKIQSTSSDTHSTTAGLSTTTGFPAPSAESPNGLTTSVMPSNPNAEPTNETPTVKPRPFEVSGRSDVTTTEPSQNSHLAVSTTPTTATESVPGTTTLVSTEELITATVQSLTSDVHFTTAGLSTTAATLAQSSESPNEPTTSALSLSTRPEPNKTTTTVNTVDCFSACSGLPLRQVCGSDASSYGNECQLNAENCK